MDDLDRLSEPWATREPLDRGKIERWIRRLRDCPVFHSEDGSRMLLLPNGRTYALDRDAYAAMVVEALTRPTPPQRLAVLAKLDRGGEIRKAYEALETIG